MHLQKATYHAFMPTKCPRTRKMLPTLLVLEVQDRWVGSLGAGCANTHFRFCARLLAAASSAATAGLSGIVGHACRPAQLLSLGLKGGACLS